MLVNCNDNYITVFAMNFLTATMFYLLIV